MKCFDKNCTREMEKRSGKFGIFYYCPDHGTISEKGVKLLEQVRESQTATVNIKNYREVSNTDHLMLEIEKQTLAFGVHMTDLDKFDIDHKYHFYDRNDVEDDDWTDVRPY